MTDTTLGAITLNIVDGVHGDCTPEDDSGFFFISVKDMQEFRIDYSSARQIRYSDFQKANLRTKLEADDVLFANTGDTIGKMLRITSNTARIGYTTFQKSIAILKPDTSKIDPLYFYYLIRFNIPGLRGAAVGSGQKNLLLGDMRTFKIRVPHDGSDQINIAKVLYAIDKKIETNAAINDNLQQQIKLLYHYWFSQFDFPNAQGAPYKSSGGEMEYSDRLKRYIPLGWTVESVINNSISAPIKPGVVVFDKKTYLATADVNGSTISSGSIID